MTRRGTTFDSTGERLAAVAALQHALRLAQALSWPCPIGMNVTTDWLCTAIVAVLSQVDPATSDKHHVASASRALASAERNHTPTEGGCLAVNGRQTTIAS
jgi:hypothetical protein